MLPLILVPVANAQQTTAVAVETSPSTSNCISAQTNHRAEAMATLTIIKLILVGTDSFVMARTSCRFQLPPASGIGGWSMNFAAESGVSLGQYASQKPHSPPLPLLVIYQHAHLLPSAIAKFPFTYGMTSSALLFWVTFNQLHNYFQEKPVPHYLLFTAYSFGMPQPESLCAFMVQKMHGKDGDQEVERVNIRAKGQRFHVLHHVACHQSSTLHMLK
jgi:hypothetical protein